MKKNIGLITFLSFFLMGSSLLFTAEEPTTEEQSIFPQQYNGLINAYRDAYYNNPAIASAYNATSITTDLPIDPIPFNKKNNLILNYFLSTTKASPEVIGLISPYTFLNLQLLHQTDKSSVLDVIDRTITPFGTALLTQWLLTIKPIKTLNKQKKIINFLKDNKNKANELRNYLHVIKQYENNYFNFFNPNQDYEKEIHKKYYYNKGSWGDWLGLSYFNSSPLMQNIYQTGGRLRTAGYAGAAAGTAYLLANQIAGAVANPLEALDKQSLGLALLAGLSVQQLNAQEKKELFDDYKKEAFKKNEKEATPEELDNASNYIERMSKSPLFFQTLQQMPDNRSSFSNKQPGATIDSLSSDISNGFNKLSTFDKFQLAGAAMQAADDVVETIGNSVQRGINNLANIPLNILNREESNATLLNYMHSQLINMGHIARQIKNIHTLLLEKPSFLKNLTYGKYIEGIFDKTSPEVSSDLRYLIELLLTNTFTGSPSWFSNQGRIIAAYLLMKNTKIEWLNIFKAIGEIDAYCSCAQLYEEYQNTPHKLVFVNFEEEKNKPNIIINDVWSILDQDSHMTIKKISLNKDNVLKVNNTKELSVVATALVLANTLGIAPASGGMKITPFTTIQALINTLHKKNLIEEQVENIVQECSNPQNKSGMQAIFIDNSDPDVESASLDLNKRLNELETVARITT